MAKPEPVDLVTAVDAATAWATDGTASALAQLCRRLAREIDATGDTPTAALAKELRATLETLEAMRDSDDAGADLAVILSTPVRDGQESQQGNARPARRKDRGVAG